MTNANTKLKWLEAVIDVSSNDTTSSSVDIGSNTLLAFMTPVGLDSTAITFEVSQDNVTFMPMRATDGSAMTLVVDANDAQYQLTTTSYAGVKYIRVIAGSSESADRTFKFVVHNQ